MGFPSPRPSPPGPPRRPRGAGAWSRCCRDRSRASLRVLRGTAAAEPPGEEPHERRPAGFLLLLHDGLDVREARPAAGAGLARPSHLARVTGFELSDHPPHDAGLDAVAVAEEL